MTFNASTPLNTDSPSIFPAQNQTNMSRLQILLGADHQFNLTAAADDGYHNVIHMTQQAPSGVLAGTGRYYAKSSAGKINAFYLDDSGADYQITPTLPIRASVNFNGTGAVGLQTIRSQYNVTSVEKISTGIYKVTFTTPMPNDLYIVSVSGMRFASVLNNAIYGSSVTTTFVMVQFTNPGSFADTLMGNVTIFSVT